jgi:atypical dual specificity phosphatase
MANSIYGVSQVNELTPGLYLTSVYGATREAVQKKGITLLVNAAQELPKQEFPGVESIKLMLDDVPYATIYVHFDRVADKIHEHISRGGRALVHCMLGVSRSTSLCLAYMMKYKSMGLKSAFDYVSARRPCVRPNPGFWRQLVEYEKRLVAAERHSTSIPITIVSTASSTPRSSAAFATVYGKPQYSTFSDYQLNYSRPDSSSSRYNDLNKSSNSFGVAASPRDPYLGYESARSNYALNDESKYTNRPSNFSTTYRSSFVRY